jgi:transmembrane sensor
MEEKVWRYFENTATSDEIREIAAWLDQKRDHPKIYAAMKKAYIETEVNMHPDKDQTGRAYNQFLNSIEKIENNHRIENSSKILYMRKTIRHYAAAVILALLVGSGAYLMMGKISATKISDSRERSLCEVIVPYGGKSSMILPDGSKIWLNAGSTLKYYRDFSIKSREVFIEGEAFFDVEKGKHPFIVHTSHFDIQVLGTTFNVKSYPEEADIVTTLVEGNITIKNKHNKDILSLKPNQKLIYHKENSTLRTESDLPSGTKEELSQVTLETAGNSRKTIAVETLLNTEETTSWKDGKLLINNEPLAELARKLERKYDITFRFESDRLMSYTYSGTLRDFPLEQVLEALELTSPIKYRIREKIVYLSFNSNFSPIK